MRTSGPSAFQHFEVKVTSDGLSKGSQKKCASCLQSSEIEFHTTLGHGRNVNDREDMSFEVKVTSDGSSQGGQKKCVS